MSLHPRVEAACEEIDAQLFSGDVSSEEEEALTAYVARWARKLKEIRDEAGQ